MSDRELDLVLWGATGFTGQLVFEHLVDTYGVNGKLKWAIAGRDRGRLEQVRDARVGPAERDGLPILLADSDDRDSLADLAAGTTAICSTVGPYARYGTPLVAACAKAGTHYCDLTGELQWMARIIPAYQDAARASGARLVHCCGFDSIPSDMGTWYLQRAMLERHGVPARQVKGRVARLGGGVSGGTVASMLNLLEEAGRDPSVRRVVADPYCLYPAGVEPGQDRRDQRGMRYDPDFRQWTSPFIMAAINTRVVRRSNALLGFPWGKGFRYEEALLERSILRAARNTLATSGGMAVLALGPTRKLARRFLPVPGEGPSRQERESGSYEIYYHAVHPTDRNLDMRLKVSSDMDPGYGSTSKMLGEAAVSLALDNLTVGGGFWTPAAAMGRRLLDRLAANAGVRFELVDPRRVHPR